MPAGFVVNPEALKNFTSKVDDIRKNYSAIVAQLSTADLSSDSSKMATLLADPGHSGPPVDFFESCRTMLSSHGELMNLLLRTHTAITANLQYIYDSLNKTQGLYAEFDQRNAEMFRRLLADFAPDGGRVDHGTP